MGQVTIYSGGPRRRRWSVAEKQALVTAAFAPGSSVVQVARKAEIAAGQIYRWRQELQASATPGFVRVELEPEANTAVEADADPAVIVTFSGATVRIMAAAPPALVGAVLRALQ